MPQLFFEPTATKIDDEHWLVTAKNNTDSIDVGEDGNTDVHNGTYHFVCKCTELVKDCIIAMWGSPEVVNGQLTGRTHSEIYIPELVEAYEDKWLPNDNGKFELTTNTATQEYDTLTDAMTAMCNFVKQNLRKNDVPQSGGDEDA